MKNDKKIKTEDIAMQSRCVHCGAEQYAMAVSEISRGNSPCVWCGKKSKQMTEREYDETLKKLFAKEKNNNKTG